jgi:hypothetical protein
MEPLTHRLMDIRIPIQLLTELLILTPIHIQVLRLLRNVTTAQTTTETDS